MAQGRVEARYTVPTGGWGLRCTNTAGGPTLVTLAAGTYYATALLTALQTAINAAMGAPDFTVAVASTEGGTGRVTISVPSGVLSIVWDGSLFTSTDLRDALGFTGNLSAVASSTSTNAMKGMWLPDSPLVLPTDDTVGHYVSDLRQSVSPTGAVYSLAGAGNVYREWDNCRWTHISKDRAIYTSGGTYPMPWERFVYETQLGGLSYFGAGSRLAVYSNATTPTLLGYYQALGLDKPRPLQAVQGWAGKWTITIPRLVNQSS